MKLLASQISFGHKREVQKNLSFELNARECLWISGPNGSGKTMLGRVLAGFQSYAGKLVCGFQNVVYLPQVQQLQNHLPFQLKNVSKGGREFLSETQLGIEWNVASGGERQKALLDRTFQQKGDLYILDEPFNHLDQGSKKKLQDFLNSYFSKSTAGLVLISHDDPPTNWLKLPIQSLVLETRE